MAKKRLGRGLDALFVNDEAAFASAGEGNDNFRSIRVSDIKPNPNQPRKSFDETALRELADSISENGLIQPIAVREEGAGYVLVAGERRLRAAKLAGLSELPAVILDPPKENGALLALIENIQRENLNPIDEAEAFESIKSETRATQESLSKMTGKSRAYIANSLRLLTHSEKIKALIREGKLTAGHARALLSVKNKRERERLAFEAAKKEGLTVRKLEAKNGERERVEPSPELSSAENDLIKKFSTKVKIKANRKYRVKIEFHFYAKDELDELLENLLRGQDDL
jgi:ParB family chromosome partitioning protein